MSCSERVATVMVLVVLGVPAVVVVAAIAGIIRGCMR
jgi:hypothetical protein